MRVRQVTIGGLLAGLAAVAGAGAIALGASGCGGSSIDPVAQAAQTTSQLAGVHITFQEQLSSGALAQPITISGTGYIDQRNRSGELSMKFPQLPGAPSSLSASTIQMVFAYPVYYMKFPLLSEKLPGHKPWIEINIQRAYSSAGLDLGGLSSLSEADPTQFLNYLRGSSGKVTDLGQATIDGVHSTHYRAEVQFDRVAEHLPADQRQGARAAIAKLAKLTGTSSIPIEVWIDSQHRVRREQLGIHEQVAGTPIDGTVTIDYDGFGATGAVTIPSQSQVYDMTGLAGSGLKSALAGG
jgi:hypothetical protein